MRLSDVIGAWRDHLRVPRNDRGITPHERVKLVDRRPLVHVERNDIVILLRIQGGLRHLSLSVGYLLV